MYLSVQLLVVLCSVPSLEIHVIEEMNILTFTFFKIATCFDLATSLSERFTNISTAS